MVEKKKGAHRRARDGALSPSRHDIPDFAWLIVPTWLTYENHFPRRNPTTATTAFGHRSQKDLRDRSLPHASQERRDFAMTISPLISRRSLSGDTRFFNKISAPYLDILSHSLCSSESWSGAKRTPKCGRRSSLGPRAVSLINSSQRTASSRRLHSTRRVGVKGTFATIAWNDFGIGQKRTTHGLCRVLSRRRRPHRRHRLSQAAQWRSEQVS
jgi:hypothetical protein